VINDAKINIRIYELLLRKIICCSRLEVAALMSVDIHLHPAGKAEALLSLDPA
jgi:hypothetical protein